MEIKTDYLIIGSGIAGLSGGMGILKTGVNASANVGFVGVNLTGTADLGMKLALGINTNGTAWGTDGVLTLDRLQNTQWTLDNVLDLFNAPEMLPHPDIATVTHVDYEFGTIELKVTKLCFSCICYRHWFMVYTCFGKSFFNNLIDL